MNSIINSSSDTLKNLIGLLIVVFGIACLFKVIIGSTKKDHSVDKLTMALGNGLSSVGRGLSKVGGVGSRLLKRLWLGKKRHGDIYQYNDYSDNRHSHLDNRSYSRTRTSEPSRYSREVPPRTPESIRYSREVPSSTDDRSQGSNSRYYTDRYERRKAKENSKPVMNRSSRF